jgi:hypothetical protein
VGFEIPAEPQQELEGGDDGEVEEEVVKLWVPGIKGCRCEGSGFGWRGPASRQTCSLRLASELHLATMYRPSLLASSFHGGPSTGSGGRDRRGLVPWC